MTAQSPQTALDIAESIKSGQTTAVDAVNKSFQTIETQDGEIQGFLALTKEQALETAAEVDKKAKAGDELPLLAGVPIALKDNINLNGTETTCASKILKGYVSKYDATVTAKIKQHLMPIVGKTNLDEFAMGSSTENSAFQKTKNPWDLERVPGGSSGGSAAVVSSDMVTLSLGSDTGGSVRQPAALCGIVGVKPTYGSVSRYGLVAFGSSLDQISPFARTVKDAAAITQVISGFDPLDSTSEKQADNFDLMASLGQDVSGLKIGVIEELSGEGFQPEIAEATEKAIETLKAQGVTVEKISLPSLKYAVPAYYIGATAEASSNLGRFDGVRYGLRVEDENTDLHTMYKQTRAQGFGQEVKRRIMLGSFCLSAGYFDAFYGKAQKTRELIRRELAQAFTKVDALICPTTPTTAFKIGEKADDPVSMYLSDIATIPVNLAGIPAMSIPCGFDKGGLPIGLQLMGSHWSEATLFKLASAYETASGFSNLTPSSSANKQPQAV